MLLEKTSYSNDFPLQIRVMQVKDYPLHYHQDIELVYVLEGEINLRSGYCTYQLHEGDLFCNNGHEVHSISSESGNNVICSIKISNSFFTQYFPKLSHSSYRTYSKVPHDEKFDTLRRYYLTILHDYLKQNFDYKKQCIYQMNELIKYLNKYFNLFSVSDKVVVGREALHLAHLSPPWLAVEQTLQVHSSDAASGASPGATMVSSGAEVSAGASAANTLGIRVASISKTSSSTPSRGAFLDCSFISFPLFLYRAIRAVPSIRRFAVRKPKVSSMMGQAPFSR